jgi:hypothetical protein
MVESLGEFNFWYFRENNRTFSLGFDMNYLTLQTSFKIFLKSFFAKSANNAVRKLELKADHFLQK